MTSSNLEVVRGTNTKPVATDALIADMQDDDLEGQLLIGFPIMASPDGRYTIDALFVSRSHGLVCFDLVEGDELHGFAERQDNAYNRLRAKLLPHQELVNRRELLANIETLTYAPAVPQCPDSSAYPIVNRTTLGQHLTTLANWDATQELYSRTLSAIQNITTIRQSSGTRSSRTPGSRSARLKDLENSISTLDKGQSKAVIETVEGVQRIRGLAGSGKTIVLALKAAYLHAQHPEWRIAVTFHTRSLKGHFIRLITKFSIEQTGEEPDWDRLRIISSWGAPGGPDRDGMYYEFCRTHDIRYFDFSSAKARFGYDNLFGQAVTSALNDVPNPKSYYDAILVDEAQDFAPEFLRLCYEILESPKRLVYAYDELQNLTHQGLPPAEEIFGQKDDGTPRVIFEALDSTSGQRDIILEKCYRNSRPVLVAAHGLGFGIYRTPQSSRSTGLVQMFDKPELWTDVGYELKSGLLRLNSEVHLTRTADTSPRFLESHSQIDDLIQFHVFGNDRSQANWVASQIEHDLTEGELLPTDIVVINTDPITARGNLSLVRKALLDRGVSSHHAGVDTSPDVFRQAGSVTCTGIYRAKGNESAMVYVINGEESHTSTVNLAHVRNRLFTAITRSTAWVRVCGIGSGMASLIEEFERIKERDFELAFRYPSQAELEQLTIVHRDMSDKEQRELEEHRRFISKLVEDFRNRRIFPQDLDVDDLTALRELLGLPGE